MRTCSPLLGGLNLEEHGHDLLDLLHLNHDLALHVGHLPPHGNYAPTIRRHVDPNVLVKLVNLSPQIDDLIRTMFHILQVDDSSLPLFLIGYYLNKYTLPNLGGGHSQLALNIPSMSHGGISTSATIRLMNTPMPLPPDLPRRCRTCTLGSSIPQRRHQSYLDDDANSAAGGD